MSLLSALRSSVSRATARPPPSSTPISRCLATVTSLPPSHKPTHSKRIAPAQGTALRPQLDIPINPNHGLFGFFRKGADDKYITIDVAHATNDRSGRSWEAVELRRKSFKDLHTLWYVLARERNLLATQLHGGRRIGLSPEIMRHIMAKDFRCRKSMARIKYVLNERRLAYAGAVDIYEKKQAEKTSVAETPVSD